MVNLVGYPSSVPSTCNSLEKGCKELWIELIEREGLISESFFEPRHLSPERLPVSFLSCMGSGEFGCAYIETLNVRGCYSYNRQYGPDRPWMS